MHPNLWQAAVVRAAPVRGRALRAAWRAWPIWPRAGSVSSRRSVA